MTRHNTWMVACLMGWLMFLGSVDAWAYKIKHTDTGAKIKWFQTRITYKVNHAMSRDLSAQQTLAAIKRSFATWNHASAQRLTFQYTGQSQNNAAGYDRLKPNKNENLLYWVESGWDQDPAAMAITITTYNRDTGEILDADIMFNGAAYRWVVVGEDKKGNGPKSLPLTAEDRRPPIDVENTLTHELGHFLGLSHSDHEDSSMYPTQEANETIKRALHHDDIDGLDELYADHNEDLTEANSHLLNTFRNGLGCSVTGTKGGPSMSLGLLGLLFFFGMMLRRKKSQPAANHKQALPLVAGLIGAAFVMLTLAPQAQATSSKWLSLKDMSNKAQVVVSGQVVQQKAAWRGKLIYTISTVKVEHCIKGSCQQKTVQVQQLGGVSGKLGMSVEGIHILKPKSHVLLFLAKQKAQKAAKAAQVTQAAQAAHRIVGLSQGAFQYTIKDQQLYLKSDRQGLTLVRTKQTFKGIVKEAVEGKTLQVPAPAFFRQLQTYIKSAR